MNSNRRPGPRGRGGRGIGCVRSSCPCRCRRAGCSPHHVRQPRPWERWGVPVATGSRSSPGSGWTGPIRSSKARSRRRSWCSRHSSFWNGRWCRAVCAGDKPARELLAGVPFVHGQAGQASIPAGGWLLRRVSAEGRVEPRGTTGFSATPAPRRWLLLPRRRPRLLGHRRRPRWPSARETKSLRRSWECTSLAAAGPMARVAVRRRPRKPTSVLVFTAASSNRIAVERAAGARSMRPLAAPRPARAKPPPRGRGSGADASIRRRARCFRRNVARRVKRRSGEEDSFSREEFPNDAPSYFQVRWAGWLRTGHDQSGVRPDRRDELVDRGHCTLHASSGFAAVLAAERGDGNRDQSGHRRRRPSASPIDEHDLLRFGQHQASGEVDRWDSRAHDQPSCRRTRQRWAVLRAARGRSDSQE